MLSLTNFFAYPKLAAFVSDRTIDFTLNEAAPELTDSQKGYLSQHAGVTVQGVAWCKQVHGTQVVVADEAFVQKRPLVDADAVITKTAGVPIAVRTADCVPVFLFDPYSKAIGLVHAGWKGTKDNIVRAAAYAMQKQFGTDFEDLLAALGPAIRSCCYKVGPEFGGHFPDAVTMRSDGLYFDMIKANRQQLLALGVQRVNIFDCRICTNCDQAYFSYRRDKDKAGRMISFMMLKP